jgi:predicted O-methyltransferase YrrM
MTDVAERMDKRLLRKLLRRLSETLIGYKLIEAAVMPEITEQRFATVENWPRQISGFEDLAYLFTHTGINYGLISQRLDEAAYLFKVAASLPAGATAAEIGRFKGGSTFLIAAALPESSLLHSYDLHLELPPGFSGELIDGQLETALSRCGLDGKVRLHVADSRTVPPPDGGVDLLFVDGDHSYEGARADVDHWLPAVNDGGHVLFHDAAAPTGYPQRIAYPGVRRLVAELRGRGQLVYEGAAGSLVHFSRPLSA